MSVRGVLRGLYFLKKYTQTKLVEAICNSAFVVAVDLQPGSVTYGKRFCVVLTEEKQEDVSGPRGCIHDFSMLSESAEFCYKCDIFCYPNDKVCLA